MTQPYKNNSKISHILKRLLFERNIRPADLSKEVKISKPTIHRIITGKSTRPRNISLQPIAEYFSITMDQLLGIENIPYLEDSFVNNTADINKVMNVPIIPWDELHTLDSNQKKRRQTIVVGGVGKNSFATIMNDFSMDPLFSKDSILIFDLQVKPIDRSYVLIKTDKFDGKYLVRQLIIGTDCKYMKSLNTDLSISKILPLSDKDKIVATLVESRHKYLSKPQILSQNCEDKTNEQYGS